MRPSRILKGIALALILLPEPITTAFGFLLLAVITYFSRFGGARSLSSRSAAPGFNHTVPKYQTPVPVKSRGWLLPEYRLPGQPSVTDRVVHRIDWERLSLRYGADRYTVPASRRLLRREPAPLRISSKADWTVLTGSFCQVKF